MIDGVKIIDRGVSVLVEFGSASSAFSSRKAEVRKEGVDIFLRVKKDGLTDVGVDVYLAGEFHLLEWQYMDDSHGITNNEGLFELLSNILKSNTI